MLVQVVQVNLVVILVLKSVKRSIRTLLQKELREIGRRNKVILLDFVANLTDASFRVTLTRKHVTGILRFVVPGQTTLLVGGNLRLFCGMQRVSNLVGHLLVASSLSL